MTKHYEQRKKANKKYLAKFDEIRIRVPNGKKEEYRQRAEAAGKSLNQYIVDCIEGDMRLYNSAIESSKAYKEQGEELTDFDDFMAEIEKEYREKEQS